MWDDQQRQPHRESSAWGAQQRQQQYFRQFMQDNDPNNQGPSDQQLMDSPGRRRQAPPSPRSARNTMHASTPNIGFGVGIIEDESMPSTSTGDRKPPARRTTETVENGLIDGVGIEGPEAATPYASISRQDIGGRNNHQNHHTHGHHNNPSSPYSNLQSERHLIHHRTADLRLSQRHSITSASENKQPHEGGMPRPYGARPMSPNEGPIEPSLASSRLGRRCLTEKPKREADFVKGMLVQNMSPNRANPRGTARVECPNCFVELQISKNCVVVNCPSCYQINPAVSFRVKKR